MDQDSVKEAEGFGRIGIVIPAFNEAENLRDFIPAVFSSLRAIDPEGEIVVVDDGSVDESPSVLRELSQSFDGFSSLRFSVNKGKAAALQAGFQDLLQRGFETIVMMDADGQDNPEELPRLVAGLAQNGDLVTGARYSRRDRFIKRTTSRLFNGVTRRVSGTKGKDFNSGFKVMTAACTQAITPMMYGELHRYIPIIAQWLGFAVSEIEVDHRPRLHGRTKYGINRFWRGLLDLITVRFLMSYRNRPAHLFGAAGGLFSFAGFVMLAFLSVRWLQGNSIGQRPMLILGVLFLIVGVQMLLFGLLAELIVFTSHYTSRANSSGSSEQ